MGAICTTVLVLLAVIFVLCCWHPVGVLVITINTTGPAVRPQTVVAPPHTVVYQAEPAAPATVPATNCATSEEFNPPVATTIPQEEEFGEAVAVPIPQR